MSPTLLELHLLLKQAEVYAEQLAQVEEKICKYYPEFKERRRDMQTVTLKLDQEKLNAEIEKARAARVAKTIEATVFSVVDGKVYHSQTIQIPCKS